MSKDFTEDEIIFAYQQIGLGRRAEDVFVEITGNAEYAELGTILMLGHLKAWYRQQTPQRLMELAGIPMLEVDK